MNAKIEFRLLPWRVYKRMILFFQRFSHKVLVSYGGPERSKVIRLIYKVIHESNMLLDVNEAYQLFMAVRRSQKTDGDLAEVGCYRGGSSKLISEAKGEKTFHVFDTFEGLPELSGEDNKNRFYTGQYSSSFDEVRNYLKGYQNVHLYKGLFPSTSGPVINKHFSFVHLDVDLYEATRDSLMFFYPRMNKGGIILSHDYIEVPGVRKAFDEFFIDKPEPIIEMSGTQCLVVKV